MFDRPGGGGTQPVGVTFTADVVAPNPTGIAVRSSHANPRAALLEHVQRFAAEGLRDLLGIFPRLGAERRELACERMFA